MTPCTSLKAGEDGGGGGCSGAETDVTAALFTDLSLTSPLEQVEIEIGVEKVYKEKEVPPTDGFTWSH